MKKLILVLLALLAIGCSHYDAEYARREQLLNAQQQTIRSVETQIGDLRYQQPGNMQYWSPAAVNAYNRLLGELEAKYQERRALIDQLAAQNSIAQPVQQQQQTPAQQ